MISCRFSGCLWGKGHSVLQAHTLRVAGDRGDPPGSMTPHKARTALRGLKQLMPKEEG